MNNARIYNALADAVQMIEQQKTEIARLRPQAEAYMRMGQMLDLAQRRNDELNSSWMVDPLHTLKSTLEKMHYEMAKEKSQAGTDKPAEPVNHEELRDAFERAATRHTDRSTAAVDMSGGAGLAGQEAEPEREPGT